MKSIVWLAVMFAALFFRAQAHSEVIRSTGAPDTFVYRAKNYRDPFVPLAKGAQAMSAQPVIKNLDELEQEFDPSLLVVKAMVAGRDKRSAGMAVIGSPTNSQENYLIQGSRIKHLPSGNILRSYAAQIQENLVIVKRIKGQPSMVSVTFPKEKEEESSHE